MPSTQIVRRVYKPILFILCALPLLWLVAGIAEQYGHPIAGITLGADPLAKLLHELGLWSLRFLIFTLCITPLRVTLGWPWLLQFRRMLGLYAFTYVLLHFLTWLVLDQTFDWSNIVNDIAKRPFITIGFAAFVLLIPLAVTSTNKMMRRLGKRWQQLHRLVYVIALLGVWHFYWQVKKDVSEPLIYFAIIAFLLGWRVWRARVRSQQGNAASAARQR
jgi:sulfoxide reductase heme-binding subunit YedZ